MIKPQNYHVFPFIELTIKQEEEINEEADNRSPAPEDMGQMGDDSVVLEESMTGSPSSNVQDGLSGPNVAADAGHRQTNGTTDCVFH